jgi:HEAT repeat protein
MSIATSCSHCGAPYNLNERMLGKTVLCKECRKSFVVEDPANASSPPEEAIAASRRADIPKPRKRSEAEDDWDEPEPERGRRPAAKKGSSLTPILLIGGGVAAVLVLGCCGVGGFFIYRASQEGKEFADKVQQQVADAQKQAEANNKLKTNPPGGLQNTPPGGLQNAPPANPPSGFGPNAGLPQGGLPQGGLPGPPGLGMQPAKPIETVADAVDALKGMDRQRRQRAAEWLVTAPVDNGRQAEVARGLEPLLEDSTQVWARLAAARALVRWGDKESVPALIRALEQKNNYAGADHAPACMEALSRFPDERGAEAVARYLENPFLNEQARRSLEAMGPVAEKAVLKYYFHPHNSTAQQARDLARAYGTKTGAIARQGIDDLKGLDTFRRRNALKWFAETPADKEVQPEVARALEPMLTDTDLGVREQVARAMINWATIDNAPALRLLLVDTQHFPVRQSAIMALGKLKDEGSVEQLAVRMLNGGDRKYAVEALIAIGGPKTEKIVLTGLSNSDRAIQVEACKILGTIGTRKSLQPLATLLAIATRKRHSEVVNAAANAIQAIKDRATTTKP